MNKKFMLVLERNNLMHVSCRSSVIGIQQKHEIVPWSHSSTCTSNSIHLFWKKKKKKNSIFQTYCCHCISRLKSLSYQFHLSLSSNTFLYAHLQQDKNRFGFCISLKLKIIIKYIEHIHGDKCEWSEINS